MPNIFRNKSGLIWICFFLSGLSGLIYQVIWVRQFELVFGAGTYAVGAVLTAFMAGLGLGAWGGGKCSERVSNPLRIYGCLEFGIGLYAFLFPRLFHGVHWAYLSLESNFHFSGFWSLILRFAGALILLILPTAFMGASLPLLAKSVTDNTSKTGWKIGRLYGINIVGAVLGVVLSGFFFLPAWGQSWTLHFAASLNLILGLAALWVSLDRSTKVKKFPPESKKKYFIPPVARAALGLTALSGFSAMIYETCFTRVLAMTLGGSVYAFSTMLLTFLTGLSLGALAASSRKGLWGEGLKFRLAGVLGAAGVAAFVTGILIDRLPYFYLWLYRMEIDFGLESQLGHRFVQLFVSSATMMPTALFLGAAFPMTVRMGFFPSARTGEWVGKVYSWNTLGAVLGSFLAAFILVPGLGIQITLTAGIYLHLAAAAVLALYSLHLKRMGPLLVGGALGMILLALSLQPVWNHHRLAIGPYAQLERASLDFNVGSLVRDRMEAMELLYFREGVCSTVTVERNKMNHSLTLLNNGKPDASSLVDLMTQQLLSHIPFFWFEGSRGRPAKRAALVGLASGITAGAAIQHSPEELVALDIEPTMPRATEIFKDYNFNVLEESSFRFVGDDARHYLELHPAAFDVIVSEPSNPWLSGVANMFTKESFEVSRRALTEGGVFCQWVQVYGMTLEDLKTIVRTLHSVFPQVALFGVPPPIGTKSPLPDLILVASTQPLRPDARRMDQLIQGPKLRDALGRMGMSQFGDLLSLMRLGPQEVTLFTGEGPFNTDDNALIEYSAPLSLYRDTYYRNMMEIRKFQTDPFPLVKTESPRKLRELMLRVSDNLYPYWRRDLAVKWRERALQIK